MTVTHSNNKLLESQRNLYFRSSILVVFAISTVFFIRASFCTLTPAPSALNFFHFISVPLTCIIVLLKSKGQDKEQHVVVRYLVIGIFTLLVVMLASAILNDAGLINVILYFLMIGEPFIMLLSVVCLPTTLDIIGRLKQWFLISCFANLILAFIQFPLIERGLLNANGLDGTDGMAGVFFLSVAGGYVSATVSIFFGLYFFQRL